MKKTFPVSALVLALYSGSLLADAHPSLGDARVVGAAQPVMRSDLPPDANAPDVVRVPERLRARSTNKTTTHVMKNGSAGATAECSDIAAYKAVSGDALADYLVNLPDYECTYSLFSIGADDAASVYSESNIQAVANRLNTLAGSYDAHGMAVVNLVLYLRAGYYNVDSGIVAKPGNAVFTSVRQAIATLLANDSLYTSNGDAPSTFSEVMKLITNIHDEGHFLADMRSIVQRFTPSDTHPDAAEPLLDWSIGSGFTGVLTVFYYSQWNSEAIPVRQTDASYPQALFDFINAAKDTLLGSSAEYQLSDTLNEAFRFWEYPAHADLMKTEAKKLLAENTMDGPGLALWMGAVSNIMWFDGENCAEYGVCHAEETIANYALPIRHTCSDTISIRAQDMTEEQLNDSCARLTVEENYFHKRAKTNRSPVADDNNTSLEVVVFNNWTEYNKFAGPIFGISTNNGGMYLEGDPSQVGNQARFIAHEASWLADFAVWNLEHEYVHYLDGRFDMYGDFGRTTALPTVWWVEGVAEYLSLKNDNQTAIDIAKTGSYALSTIFGNTYGMDDYVTRAYRWGYMAVRFMYERHPEDIDTILALTRENRYEDYWAFMQGIGTRYDTEFAEWVLGVTTNANQKPVVTIGDSASHVEAGSHFILTADATDADGDRLQYRWTYTGPNDVQLGATDTATLDITAPAVDSETPLQFSVAVDDGINEPSVQSVTITVTPKPAPVNHAPSVSLKPAPNAVLAGAAFALSVEASDADGDSLSYRWSHDGGSDLAITGTDSATVQIVAPAVTRSTALHFTAHVSDGKGGDVEQRVTVSVEPKPAVNQAPSVRLKSAPASVESGAEFSLVAEGQDADNDALSYDWTYSGASGLSLSGEHATELKVKAPSVSRATSLVFTVTVRDNKGGQAESRQTVTVKPASTSTPTPTPAPAGDGGGGGGAAGLGLFGLLLLRRLRRLAR